MRHVLAVDVGGTKLACGIVSEEGQVLAERRAPTPQASDPDVLFAAVAELAQAAITASGVPIDGVGAGCGGPMRWPEGAVSPLHIPAWRDFPLRGRLTALFGAPCFVDNDAKAFALGEHWLGAGRGARALLGIVVSTGVGAGIVVGGRLLHGASGQTGHFGHVLADPDGPPCACGARGCVEALASGSAIARRGAQAVPALAERARANEASARDLFAEAGRALARGIASAAALLDLDRVVIGGGVALGAWDLLEDSLTTELADRARIAFARDLRVTRAALGDRGGLLGAAKLVLDI